MSPGIIRPSQGKYLFRNLVEGFDDLVMETACGLHNLRIDHPMTA